MPVHLRGIVASDSMSAMKTKLLTVLTLAALALGGCSSDGADKDEQFCSSFELLDDATTQLDADIDAFGTAFNDAIMYGDQSAEDDIDRLAASIVDQAEVIDGYATTAIDSVDDPDVRQALTDINHHVVLSGRLVELGPEIYANDDPNAPVWQEFDEVVADLDEEEANVDLDAAWVVVYDYADTVCAVG